MSEPSSQADRSSERIDLGEGCHIDPGCNYLHSDAAGVCTKCGWVRPFEITDEMVERAREGAFAFSGRQIPVQTMRVALEAALGFR